MTLAIQNLYNDPQGNALNSVEGIIMLIVIAVLFLVWYAVTGGDMGTHSDTGAPVKSLNTKEGKRAGQRRRYHQKKYPKKYEAAVESIEREFEEYGIESIRKGHYELLEQSIKMEESGIYLYRPEKGLHHLDMFIFPEDE